MNNGTIKISIEEKPLKKENVLLLLYAVSISAATFSALFLL